VPLSTSLKIYQAFKIDFDHRIVQDDSIWAIESARFELL
jgi:hypothetical protein